ncbi:MAG: hypothetical protein ACP5VR_09055 [Acidimicrobiales bacterium]
MSKTMTAPVGGYGRLAFASSVAFATRGASSSVFLAKSLFTRRRRSGADVVGGTVVAEVFFTSRMALVGRLLAGILPSPDCSQAVTQGHLPAGRAEWWPVASAVLLAATFTAAKHGAVAC